MFCILKKYFRSLENLLIYFHVLSGSFEEKYLFKKNPVHVDIFEGISDKLLNNFYSMTGLWSDFLGIHIYIYS